MPSNEELKEGETVKLSTQVWTKKRVHTVASAIHHGYTSLIYID
jgi:hypothetical protein